MGHGYHGSLFWLSSLICLLSLPIDVYAQFGLANYNQNHFLNPPTAGDINVFTNNPAYEIGNVLEIRWTTNSTDFPRFTLTLWQPGLMDQTVNLFSDQNLIQAYHWPVDVGSFQIDGVNASTGVPLNVFYLYMYPTGNYSAGFSSQYFNVTYPPNAVNHNTATFDLNSPSTTYSDPPATYTSTAIGGAATGIVLPTGSTRPTTFATPSASGEHSIALPLILGLGIPAVVGVAVLLCCLLHRRRKDREAARRFAATATGAGGPASANIAAAAAASSSSAPPAQQMRWWRRQMTQQAARDSAGGARSAPQDAGMQVAQLAVASEYYAPSAAGTGTRTAVYTEHFAPQAEAPNIEEEGVRTRDFAAQPSRQDISKYG